MHEQWLEDSGELLVYQQTDDEGPSAPPIDNRRAYIQVASAAYDPATPSPQWGPAINYVWNDISADIPPGQADRPSKWQVAGVETTYLDTNYPLNPTWTLTAGQTLTRALLSRKPLRFGYLCSWTQQTPPLPVYNQDWPLINCANFAGAGDTPDMIAQIPVEDVVNYDNSRLVQLTFARCPAGLDPATLTLRLTHSHFDFMDENYTPESYGSTFRFGSDSDFPDSYQRTQRTDDFKVSGQPSDEQAPDRGWTLTFDLAQLQRTNTVHLQHVDQLEIIGLPAGDYELADWRLIKTPDAMESA
jgi:hypothetical protein